MKKLNLITIPIIVILAVFGLYSVFAPSNDGLLEGSNFAQNPVHREANASSTALTVGDDLSVLVLPASAKRAYASLCNTQAAHTAYLSFSSTAITATTSASIPVNANSCYIINLDNRYIGNVHVIQETASTTATFLVTELRTQ